MSLWRNSALADTGILGVIGEGVSSARTDLNFWATAGCARQSQSPWTVKPVEEKIASSTELQKPSESLYQKIEGLFSMAIDQDFEDGMEDEFSRELTRYIEMYGNEAVGIIASLL